MKVHLRFFRSWVNNMETILNAAQSVAFPILMCCVMAYYIKHVQDNYVNKMIDTLSKSLENNTKALNELKGVMYARRKEDSSYVSSKLEEKTHKP